jgi:hypothetical protein
VVEGVVLDRMVVVFKEAMLVMSVIMAAMGGIVGTMVLLAVVMAELAAPKVRELGVLVEEVVLVME